MSLGWNCETEEDTDWLERTEESLQPKQRQWPACLAVLLMFAALGLLFWLKASE